jgi:RsiW-degrading membrane proteinase PrsW (M82 family)
MMRRNNWLKLFLIGLVTYAAGFVVMILTLNPNLYPSVIILGNFLIPVTYVSFFYERRLFSNVSMLNVALSFFYGGFLGTFADALIEPFFIHRLDFYTAMIVGIIEELVKVLGVFVILKKSRHKLEIDGIILGAAAGMGFAALESSGYAFTTFLSTRGSFSMLIYITIMRGIFSPLAHGTWTAILTGVILRERTGRNLKVNLYVLYAYILVIILHGAWDGLPYLLANFVPVQSAAFISYIFVGVTGILVLRRLWKEAKLQAMEKFKAQSGT